jgi:phosphatidylserine/phosphatidylglycerophosphate/cardiolipin synthase-like enzyme
VLISTGVAPSWFDQVTMDRTRGAMIWRLQAADVFGRFRAYYPTTPNGEVIIVHSKVSVFDDRIARVGSANLNNRSGGFDTECELSLECDEERAKLTIAAFRDRLVGHFMGYTGDAVAKARADFGGLAGAVDALNREGRLTPIKPPKLGPVAEFIAAYHLGDPSDTKDSWRLGRRRDRLFKQARVMAESGRADDWQKAIG